MVYNIHNNNIIYIRTTQTLGRSPAAVWVLRGVQFGPITDTIFGKLTSGPCGGLNIIIMKYIHFRVLINSKKQYL